MISGIFNASFLFSIAIIIAAVGGLYLYFNRKFLEQNHKMQSMLGLVSTMAEEMQYFRSKITNQSVDNNGANTVQIIPNFLGGNEINDNGLIAVSDSEVDDSGSEVDDSGSEVDDSEVDDSEVDDSEGDDSESDLEDDSGSEDDDSDLEVDDLEVLDVDDLENDNLDVSRKIIKIDLGIDTNDEVNFNIESEDVETEATTETKTINLDLESQGLEDMDLSLKSISIDGENVTTNKTKDDYKKMSLNKLREVVMEKGLIPDSSKLKKNELLKLLGAE